MSSNAPEEFFARRTAARWLVNILDEALPVDDSFFNCAGWICGGLSDFARRLKRDIILPRGKNGALSRAREGLKEIDTCRLQHLDDYLESLYNEHPILQKQILIQAARYLEEIAKTSSPKGGDVVLRRLKSLFDLKGVALSLCFYAFSIKYYRPLEQYLEDTLELGLYSRRHIFGKMIGANGSQIQQARNQLTAMGILDSAIGNNPRINSSVEEALLYTNARAAHDFFCQPLPGTDLSMAQFNLPEEMKNHALKLLAKKSEKPVHILLYGAPGSGKTTFASLLAQTLGLKAWSVRCGINDNTRDRRAALCACLKIAQAHDRAFILVDEAELLLDTDNPDLSEGSAKAWLNSLLEQKKTRIIWITNRVEHLDLAVRRRFSYSIYFDSPGIQESLTLWNAVAKRLHLENRLPPETRDRFAKLYQVPVAMMEMTLRQAKAVAGARDFTNWVERALEAHVSLCSNGFAELKKPAQADRYDPECVCAAVTPEIFLARGAKLAEKIEKGSMPGLGAMLFYGPPGTGKSELARQLAKNLKKDLLVKKPSDLLDPYVGVTEQKIAQAFRKAERTGAILLIDEADTFLFSRQSAQHSWETSMINEFLASLEAFLGLCICTTNFRAHLDPAVMRRFPTKLEFYYARPDQIKKLYINELMPLLDEEADSAVLETLARQRFLTPGDFAAVKRRMWLEEQPNQSIFLKALLDEQRLKLENEAKNVGF